MNKSINGDINKKLEILAASPYISKAVNNKLIGIEKESLRTLKNGHLSNTQHPKTLGSKLTNQYITTDYAEAQLELITKPFHHAEDTLEQLQHIHQFVYYYISNNELIWPYSIPGYIPTPKNIMIANFGTSAIGKFKELYRLGLSYRYGKTMQLICGSHFNFSFSEQFWDIYFNTIKNKPNWNKSELDSSYMDLIRNYMRISWLPTYLCGASPALSSKFINQNTATAHYLKLLNNSTYLSDYGTTVRESNLGYHNKNNLDLTINYNSLKEYTNSLYQNLHKIEPEFEELGLHRRNKQIQINCNSLQIENEYYGIIRPKPNINLNNLSVYKSLDKNGIAYIELRNLDLNPFSPIGIDINQCNLLECLLYYCCLNESKKFDDFERAYIKSNREKTALLGRQPNLQLKTPDGKLIKLTTWAKNIFEDLKLIAKFLDNTAQVNAEHSYSDSINYYYDLLNNSSLLPSAKIANNIKEKNLNYIDYFIEIANSNSAYYLESQDLSSQIEFFDKIALESISKQQEIEQHDIKTQMDLAKFIENYKAS